MKSISRKEFIKRSAAVSAGFYGLSHFLLSPQQLFSQPLQSGNKWLELPEGFDAHLISESGQPMSDGFLVPGRADGMGSFSLGGKTIIVRNHELNPQDLTDGAFGKANELLDRLRPADLFDHGHGSMPSLGGTTNLVFNETTGKVEQEFLSLAGTNRNCAGGITPWNTWITCEEDVTPKKDTNETAHGFNFEVPASANGLLKPVPLKAMGRFNHEAVSVNPVSGYVYQTEDTHDSLIYRFIPNTPGKLEYGGELQALMIKGKPGFDTRNWEQQEMKPGDSLETIWITLDDVESEKNDLRIRGREMGAAVFARGEGMWYGNEEIYFACTNGGQKNLGQVFKYIPSPLEGSKRENEQPGKLVLFAESIDMETLKNCDNLTVAPWGDVVLCEDHTNAYIRGITPEGKLYNIARNIYSDSELAGLCFSPSGKYLFVNIQEQGLTLAITGPWGRLKPI